MVEHRKLKGFSLVELMMLLLVASLIVAALMPVITKKHFRLPSLVNHGAYMCYYKAGRLHEAKFAGKINQQLLYDREVTDCVFEPPKRAAYFQVSAIGGGGGGGDSGYTGGQWYEAIMQEEKMSPFGITEDTLKKDKIDPDEFKKFAGELYGCAKSLGSGKGGDIGYMSVSDNEVCTNYKKKTEKTCTKSKEVCDATWNPVTKECSRYTCTIKTKYKEETKPEIITTGGGCKEWGKKEVCVWETKYENCQTRNKNEGKTGCVRTCSNGTSECKKSICNSGGNSSNGFGCSVSPCNYPPSYETKCDETQVKKCEMVDDPDNCLDYYETNTTTITVTTRIPDGTETVKEVAAPVTTETKEECLAASSVCLEEKEVTTTTDECEDDAITYAPKFSGHIEDGESGGTGAYCITQAIAGGLNLRQPDKFNNIPNILVSDLVGSDKDASSSDLQRSDFFCLAATAEHGKAACAPEEAGGVKQDKCVNPSYASTTMYDSDGNSFKAKAVSAAAGGAGARRIDNGPYTTLNGLSFECSDDYISAGNDAINGYCAPGEGNPVSSSNYPCSGNNGYCLLHLADTFAHPSTKMSYCEEDGEYNYKYSFDKNYLGYGNAGSPGEFKTVIVRSLKNLDTTIKVGRGGASAAKNTGTAGAAGSPTSIGKILVSQGGAGGAGGQNTEAEVLPAYDRDIYAKEKQCYNYKKYLERDEYNNFVDTSDEAKKFRVEVANISANSANDSAISTATSQIQSYCGDLFNNINSYQFFKRAGGNNYGDYPTPTGVFTSFMNVVFTQTSSGTLLDSFAKFGKGGRGGTTIHKCWAGRHEIFFERMSLHTSVYPTFDVAQAAVNGQLHLIYNNLNLFNPFYDGTNYADTNAIKEGRYVPKDCHDDWENVVASPGVDGALLIKW